MVSAELVHNPYLLETTALFNGREPKVNSAIERFEGHPLVEWTNKVPQTFRDEMNGLDFDLYFTGTGADYQRVVKAFSDQGITVLDTSSPSQTSFGKATVTYDVRLALKGTFEDVSTKRQEISDLIAWLNEHRNRWFDYDEFIATNAEALDGSVPYIIVNEKPIQLELPSVAVETVDSARYDLANTELSNTPILFMINSRNGAQFRNELQYVMKRRDVDQGQLFFYIHPSMNKERAIRVISDLGIDNPQVVDKPDDPTVIQYLDDYPSMRYIRRSINILSIADSEISATLDKFVEESSITSADRMKQIEKLDQEVEVLKGTRQSTGRVDPYEAQEAMAAICEQFESHILKWRNKKPSITGQDQIWRAASDFDYELRGWVSRVEKDIAATMQSEQQRVEHELDILYNNCRVPSFTPQVEVPHFHNAVAIPNVIDALINQTGTEQVTPRSDLFGLFGAGGHTKEDAEYVEIASYDVWRTTVHEMMKPSLQEAVKTCEQELVDYRDSLVEAYQQQLSSLIELLLNKRESLTAQLSDEEKMLEEDRAWLSEFKARLLVIERN